jgi:transcriptional regulator with XRE-family HTH domain
MEKNEKRPSGLQSNAFGRLVREYREQMGLSQEEVAERWGYTREYVSLIEGGKRKLDQIEQVYRLADILQIPHERLDAIGKGIPQRKIEPQHPSEGDDALFQALLEPAQATVKLSRLVWHTDHEAMTIAERLHTLNDRLEDALTKYRGRFVKPTQQIMAYAHEMLGEMAFDQLSFSEAYGHFQEMLDLGEELADNDIIALAMTRQADLLRKKGRYEAAFRRFQAVEPYASNASKYVQGFRWQILARAYSLYGDAEGFQKAIDNAQEIVESTNATLDTVSNRFDLVQVLQERAQGYTILWQPEKALDIYQQTDALKPFRPLRDQGSYSIIQAQAFCYVGNLDTGVEYAIKGVKLARAYHSKRHISRVQGMYDRLSVTRMGKSPRLRELKEVLGG